MTAQIEEKNEKITESYKKKDSLRDEHWKLMFDSREQKDEINYIDWLQEEKDRLKSDEEEREKHIAGL